MVGMHTPDAEMARLASKALLYSIDRIRIDPPPLGAPRPYEELLEAVGQTITKEGITGAEALRLFTEVLAPSSISVDHPKFLSFVPGAPTEASIIFDMVVSAANMNLITNSVLFGLAVRSVLPLIAVLSISLIFRTLLAESSLVVELRATCRRCSPVVIGGVRVMKVVMITRVDSSWRPKVHIRQLLKQRGRWMLMCC